MITLPAKVKSTFLKLKRANGKYVEIKHIKKYFFAYQSTSRWSKEKRKPIKVTSYLGRITNKGQFIPAKKRKPRNISQQIATESLMEQPILDAGQKTLENVTKDVKRYKHESTLLTALSMNGRISMSVLGRMVGIKETAVSLQVKKLEKKYGIKYMAEIDITKLGYIQFLITVKFLDEFPKTEELKSVLINDVRIQLAFLTKGDFDLMMYALAKSIEEISFLLIELREKFDYRATWNAAPVFEDYGYIPIRNEFIDYIKSELLSREYAVLKELRKNGKIDFTEIDNIYGFDKGRSQYSYYRLKERGAIKRITISMNYLPIRYIAAIFEDIVNGKQFKINREKVLRDIVSNTPFQINKYLLIDDTINPKGILLYLPIFNDGDLETAIENFALMNIGTINRTVIITSLLLGEFCFRSFDNVYSIQEEILIKEYKLNYPPKIDYEETGRIKKERKKYKTDIRGLKPEN
ncbi:MAG: Lrp/AsnC family transcriptional regulator [Candidatus Micrarchaeota archaeon]|nr:Lrp/AsnC family transcriptional regulator [Candidatus Micrarchaeota archaeon]